MLRSSRFLVGALAPAFVTLGSAAPAWAQSAENRAPIEVDEANRLFREGREDFNAGRIKDAHRKYRTAWKLRKSPDVAANMAQAELELELYDQAAMHFAYALAYLLPSTSREQRVALETALADVKTKVGELQLRVRPPDAQVTLNGEPVDSVFLETGIFVPPGGHVVGATAEGRVAAERKVAVAAGQSVALTIRLEPQPTGTPDEGEPPAVDLAPPSEPDVTQPPRGRTTVLVTGGALAAVGIGVGAAFLARSAKKNRDADELREVAILEVGPGGCESEATEGVCGDLWDTLLEQGRSRNVAVGGFVAGGVFAAATITTALAWPKASQPRAGRLSLDIAAGPRDAWATVSGRF